MELEDMKTRLLKKFIEISKIVKEMEEISTRLHIKDFLPLREQFNIMSRSIRKFDDIDKKMNEYILEEYFAGNFLLIK